MSLNDTTSKFWVTRKFQFQNVPENFDCQHIISVIIPRIYQHNINYFQLFRANIYFDDFVFLVSKCEAISLWNVTVKNKDGSVVALDKLIEVTPKLKHLT
uniref:Uncharacterized protein n=1 Tax=Panagrolaimus davidi TaxID=227884 RepID=A0A914R9R4_9BILA